MDKMKYREKEWMRMYNLAKIYYEHYGNLDIPSNFKTINGYEYDEKGDLLGLWIKRQRLAYHGKGRLKITKEEIILLNKIGMKFEFLENEWLKKYHLAKKYYEHYENLNIPYNFKTLDGITPNEKGINMGVWLTSQKSAYLGKGKRKISCQRIKMLDHLNIRWFTKAKNKKLKFEQITIENLERKQTEIVNRLYSCINDLDANTLLAKEEIEKSFVKKL